MWESNLSVEVSGDAFMAGRHSRSGRARFEGHEESLARIASWLWWKNALRVLMFFLFPRRRRTMVGRIYLGQRGGKDVHCLHWNAKTNKSTINQLKWDERINRPKNIQPLNRGLRSDVSFVTRGRRVFE